MSHSPGAPEHQQLQEENAALRKSIRQLQQRLHHAEQQLELHETALASNQEFSFLLDRNNRFLHLSRGLLDLLQTTPEAAHAQDFADQVQQQVALVFATGERLPLASFSQPVNGILRDFEYSLAPVCGQDGSVEFVAGAGREIVARKKTAAQEEENFGLAALQAPIGIVLVSQHGKFLDANQAYLNMVGYRREELIERGSEHFTHPEDIPKTLAFTHALRQGGRKPEILEKRYVRKDGSLLWVRVSGMVRQYQDGVPTMFIAVVEDITHRKRVEQELRDSQARLEQVFSQAPVAIVVLVGTDFVVELANPFAEALMNGREIRNKRLPEVLPELGPNVWQVLGQVMNTGQPHRASEWHIPYDYDRDGTLEDHWFNVVFHPVLEMDGRVSGIVVVCSEVTVQVRARQEMERVHRELEEFSYVASHDLQEPLRMVGIYTQLLLRRFVGDHPEAAQYGQFIRQGVDRMEALIRDLLNYSKTIQRDEAPVGLADLPVSLADAIAVLNNHIEEVGAIVHSTALPVVRGDTRQFSHVFQNLISNAIKYGRAGVPTEIEISAIRRAEDWLITVEDNGIGFDPIYAERIFGLFKRLHKDEYPGTGLGLAICQRIVERYGGKMWADGKLGAGAQFYISLPHVGTP
ncbi:sensor histidine kinase [Bryobacter aggregatus]|uniref:sensor histidine kinase n=1 Tax=Bryobacter aggregatus TaxID=360054 RepID=UPI0004E11C99|nr:PAS domain S-box protein [Bryobacter aggregatus]